MIESVAIEHARSLSVNGPLRAACRDLVDASLPRVFDGQPFPGVHGRQSLGARYSSQLIFSTQQKARPSKRGDRAFLRLNRVRWQEAIGATNGARSTLGLD
jgi:hypothetical protein